MRKTLFTLAIVLISLSAQAQEEEVVVADTSWKRGGNFDINFSRVSLQNWAGGGQSSIALGTKLSYFADFVKGRSTWKNSLDIAYGITRVGDKDNLFKKSDDQLLIASKYSYKIIKDSEFGALNFTGLLDYRSQLANGFNYVSDTNRDAGEKGILISRFMAPGYLLTSGGIEYKKKDFYAVISPATGKFTFVLEDNLSAVGAFGVTPGENIRAEFGTLIKSGYKKEIIENVEISSDIILFSSYHNFGNIDVNWQTTIKFKINKYLTTTFSTLLIYDDDIDVVRQDGTTGPAIQYKDVLNIGLNYKF